ncbi:MAG TPA: SPOR domain-containing protein [Clostridia bacterium]|nr:SPOR domain-containing protein [Clostridia bacterium]
MSSRGFEPRRRSSARRGAPVVLFFLVLVLIAILTGYTLGKYVLTAWLGPRGEPASGLSDKTEATTGEEGLASGEAEMVAAQASPINLFRLQLGAFSSRERAQRAAEEAMSKGVAALALESDKAPFRVVGGLYASREAADKAAASLKAKGFDAYVTALQVPGVNVSLDGVPQDFASAVTKSVANISAFLADQAALWDEVTLGGQPAEGRISNMENLVSESSAALGGVVAPNEWVSVYDALKGVVDRARENANALKDVVTGGSPAERAETMVDYMLLVQLYEKCLSEAVTAASAQVPAGE